MVIEIRKSTRFLIFLFLVSLILTGLLFVHPHVQSDAYKRGMTKRRELVRELQLTDLCLFTEARYTRHLSQADLHSPFQDYPMAFEHFPSGSLVMPPEHLGK